MYFIDSATFPDEGNLLIFSWITVLTYILLLMLNCFNCLQVRRRVDGSITESDYNSAESVTISEYQDKKLAEISLAKELEKKSTSVCFIHENLVIIIWPLYNIPGGSLSK